MTELKQSRWVKVHAQGQANFQPKENIMDILIGTGSCQADVVYTVRSHKKAAFWLNKYLEAAGAVQLLHDIADQIEKAAENKQDVELNTETWSCQIERMEQNIFKIQLRWTPAEPVTIQEKVKKTVVKADNTSEAKAKKSRGRKKAAA